MADKRDNCRLLDFLSIWLVAFSLTLANACNSSTNPITPTASFSPAKPSPTISKTSPVVRPSPYVILPSPSSPSPFIKPSSSGFSPGNYAGIEILAPFGASRTNLNPDEVTFSWRSDGKTTEYQFILATNAALTETVAGTPVNVQATYCQVKNLEFGKIYFWAIEATKPNLSIQTISTFTTSAPPATPNGGLAITNETRMPAIPEEFPHNETPLYIYAILIIGVILIPTIIILLVKGRRGS